MSVAELGYYVDSSGVVRATGDLDKMTAAAIKSESAKNVLSKTSRETSTSITSVSTAASSAAKSIISAQQSASMAEASFKGLGAEVAATQRETAIYRAEMDALRAQFNPLFAASKQYEDQLDRIANAERLGAISAKEAADARTRASNQLGMVNGQMNVAAGRMAAFSKQTRVGASQTANLGAQLNDIGVMLAAGQNPLQLAVQQGTQINQVFAQMGGGKAALRGLAGGFMSMVNPMSLATIGIIAGGAALVQWGVAAASSEDEVDALADRYEELERLTGSLSSATDILKMSMVELTETYGSAAMRVREFTLLQSELRIAELTQSLAEHSSVLADVTDKYTGASGNVTTLRTSLMAIQRDFGMTSEQAVLFRKALTDAANAETFDQQVAALQSVDRLLRDSGVSASDIPPELAKALAEMIDLSNETDAARKLANDLAGAVSDIAPSIDPAIDSAAALKNELGAALALLNKINMQESLTYSGRGGDPRDFMGGGSKSGYTSELNYESPQDIIDTYNKKNAPKRSGGVRKKGGGGRGKTDTYGNDIESLIESLQTERETVDAWYAESDALLNDRRAMELLGAQGHNEAKLRLEAEYQERLAGIQEMGAQNSVTTALDGAADMFGALGAISDKALKAQAITAAGSAWISTLVGAAKELEKGTFGFKTALAVISKGAGFVAAIKAAGSGGSSGGGGGGTSAPSAGTATAPAQQQQRVVVQLSGRMGDIVAPMMDEIVKNLQNKSKNGVIIEGFTRA